MGREADGETGKEYRKQILEKDKSDELNLAKKKKATGRKKKLDHLLCMYFKGKLSFFLPLKSGSTRSCRWQGKKRWG
jgi:hypothetical protein